MSCTLSDVIKLVPFEQSNGNTQTPQDYLNQMLNLISRLRGGASRYVPLLMAKVAENVPNMSNPLTHMPHSLEAYMEDSPRSAPSPQEMIRPPHIARAQPPMQLQMPAQLSTTQYTLPSMQAAYSEQLHTPQSQATPHQERLMFEAYSPSINSHTEAGLTPPVFGTPQSQFVPRSVPLSSNMIKQETWDNYRG